MVHFPSKISAVPCKDGCPPVEEPSLLPRAHVYSGQGPPKWYFTDKAMQSV